MSMFEPVEGVGEKKRKDDQEQQQSSSEPKKEEVIKTLSAVSLDLFNQHMRLSVEAFNRLKTAFQTRNY
jgi:hypothetical protein